MNFVGYILGFQQYGDFYLKYCSCMYLAEINVQ